MLEKLFILTPSEVVSSDTNLPPTPEMSSGLGIIREHSHLAEPDIRHRHILFSTCNFLISLLVSNLTPANRTGYN